MPQHIAFIIHHPESRSNRIADLLAARGYAVDWYCPREGEPLPAEPESLAGAVLLGGAMSANDDSHEAYLREEYRWLELLLNTRQPFLGICLGAQMLARVLGGKIAPHPRGLTEVGYYPVTGTAAGRPIFGDTFHVFHWHREGIQLPVDVEILARGETYAVQAFRDSENAYGLQFHPEVTRTIFTRWIQEAPHSCDWPGAQAPEQIRQGWHRYDRAIEIQTDRLLDIWLQRRPRESPRPDSGQVTATPSRFTAP